MKARTLLLTLFSAVVCLVLTILYGSTLTTTGVFSYWYYYGWSQLLLSLPLCNLSHSDSQTLDRKTRTLFMFTGRWEFLRVGLPYIYRDLRKNGGVLDKVLFMMVQYTSETHAKLSTFISNSNNLLQEEIFEMRYMPGYKPGQPMDDWHLSAPLTYDQIFRDLMNHPCNQYLKADDDVIYYHPDALKKMFATKNSSKCFMHFGNIAGTNWRCSITHQRMGLFNNSVLNPKKLKFEYHPSANCGWKSPECAEVTLQAFVYYYNHQQLDKYLFTGLELLPDRKRFSINFFLLDRDLIRVKEMIEVGPITPDDERWWTVKYAPKPSIKQPNCIVGESLVVHFSYGTTSKRMIELGYLKEFEKIVQQEVGSNMPQLLWKLLDY